MIEEHFRLVKRTKAVGADARREGNKKRVSEETLLRAANGTRTRDLLITNELLYQLS